MEALNGITLPYLRRRNLRRWGLFFLGVFIICSLTVSKSSFTFADEPLNITPAADGHYHYYWGEECFMGDCSEYETGGIGNAINLYHYQFCTGGPFYSSCEYIKWHGIIEFDISIIDGLFTSGQLEAQLSLKVMDVGLFDDCLSIYNIMDSNENGIIEESDIDGAELIDEICVGLSMDDVVTFDVTSFVEDDLLDQEDFSGFYLSCYHSVFPSNDSVQISFYDHTDPINAPMLSVIDIYSDYDEDGIPYIDDNCPTTSNPGQEDTYPPPVGNGCGDACECEGNFDDDQDQDGTDSAVFKADFGRSPFFRPCTNVDPCNGDFDCDGDVDGTDAVLFKSDFGRSPFFNPCPYCPTDPWCSYP